MKDINQLLTDAKSGEISYQEAVDAIDSTNIPDVVADYLKSQIPNNQKTSTPIFGNPFEGGFFNNLWGGIKNIFK